MKKKSLTDPLSTREIELYQPTPNVLYSLEVTAHLAGVPRRSILVYCRAGLLKPMFQAPYGVMVFSEETIHRIRRIEQARADLKNELSWLKRILALTEEVARLRSELRFFYNY